MNTIHHIARWLGTALTATAFSFVAFAVPVYAAGEPLANPLRFKTIAEFIAGALQVLVMIALPIIVLFLVIAGFKFISAQGNEGKLGEAKKNFFYVIIGAGLIMGAWILAKLIAGTVSQLTG